MSKKIDLSPAQQGALRAIQHINRVNELTSSVTLRISTVKALVKKQAIEFTTDTISRRIHAGDVKILCAVEEKHTEECDISQDQRTTQTDSHFLHSREWSLIEDPDRATVQQFKESAR